MNREKFLIIIAVAIVVVIGILAFGLKKGGKTTSATLEFWSVYDERDVYADLFTAFQEENKRISIKYEKKSFDEYEEDLINALAAGKGPDIFSIHNTWLPRHKDKISPMPQTEGFLNFETFRDIFVDVAFQDFVDENGIYAIPFYIDTLALYYNKDFFNSAAIPVPPATWDEFLDDVEKLTKRDKWGNIEKAGIAMGTAENINRSTDILSLLMLQTGAEMTDEARTKAAFNQITYLEGQSFRPGINALRFYTDFSNPTKRIYSWNRQMPYSIDAFYQGKAAMMINYSHRINTIKSRSPYLNFDIASVPQIKDRKFDVNYANYWGQAVSKKSRYPEAAWKLILFLARKENVKMYLQAAKRSTSRRDLIQWQRDATNLDVFANQALSAKSWYQADSSAIEKVFADMIESVVLGAATVEQAINKAADQVGVLMK